MVAVKFETESWKIRKFKFVEVYLHKLKYCFVSSDDFSSIVHQKYCALFLDPQILSIYFL